jgi:hypothetical protein
MAIPINWWAIIVTTVVSFVLGFLWFGPVFGKVWMKTIGVSMPPEITPEMKKGMMIGYFWVLVTSLITNFVLLHNITFGSQYLHMTGIGAGLQAAIWNWLGFCLPLLIASVMFESRPKKYILVTGGYYLVAMLINGMILASWM